MSRFSFSALFWAAGLSLMPLGAQLHAASAFHIEEATISDIQHAILSKQVTTTDILKMYLKRIQAYNGPAVDEPYGILGPITTIAHAKGINALSTLNLRPARRKEWGFDDHHARSMVDRVDNDPNMPDAFEVAAKLDAYFAKTGKLMGPLHGVFFAIKDQYNTFDMRSTSGADAFYANDRPPQDSVFVQRLRAAGAIILGKANLAEYADGIPRSSFGGVFANPYDTTRDPGISSSGSGSAVGANLVTCAIAEETGSSIRGPAHRNSCVGIAVTEELVPRTGMIQKGIQTRVGPIARTVEDAARVLTVIAGYDASDPLTAFSYGRTPDQPYETFTHAKSLKGLRIGVVREYMDKTKFAKADEENIDIVLHAIDKLKELGATLVDPGEGGELFTKYIQALNPMLMNAGYMQEHPELFPVDPKTHKPTGDNIAKLIDLVVDPTQAPGKFTLRDLGSFGPEGRRAGRGSGPGTGAAAADAPPAYGTAVGEAKFEYNLYLRERGDARIKTLTDLYTRASFFHDPQFTSQESTLQAADKAMVLDSSTRMQRRFAVQEIILQAMADMQLDAIVYPTCNLPPAKIGQPAEPPINGRVNVWTFIGSQGIPAMTVQAGYTTHVYDRIRDPAAPPPPPGWTRGAGGAGFGGPNSAPEPTIVVGPTPAVLPVGMDIAGRPFSEPTLLKIAGAFQDATHYRHPPPDFGPVN